MTISTKNNLYFILISLNINIEQKIARVNYNI